MGFAAAAGRFVVRGRIAGATAEAPLEIVDRVAEAPAPGAEALSSLAVASGGVVVHPGNMEALRQHIERIGSRRVPVDLRPMRSPWWMLPFGAALCGEWAIRRRCGRR